MQTLTTHEHWVFTTLSRHICDVGFTSMSAGSISPRLHLDPGLCRFSQLFYGIAQRPVSSSTRSELLIDGFSSHDTVWSPKDSGSNVYEGLHHLEGFLQPPLEGYHISKDCTSSMADLSLLQDFSFLYSRFPRKMFSHTSSFLGAYSICMPHTPMFCVCPPPHPFFPPTFPSCVFLISLLCAPLCANSLGGH